MGLLEYPDWCEDLNMEPVLAVYAGFSLKQQRVAFGSELQPYLRDALDEIEYVTGAANTTWGAQRAKDGHPAPFKLTYAEVGNEDNFDRQEGSYEGRFSQFYEGIKAQYPQLQIISTTKTKHVTDVIDEHYYRNSEDLMASTAHMYDMRTRPGQKVFVGEWATRGGEPTPNMSAALGDAAWMTGMERNSERPVGVRVTGVSCAADVQRASWRCGVADRSSEHSGANLAAASGPRTRRRAGTRTLTDPTGSNTVLQRHARYEERDHLLENCESPEDGDGGEDRSQRLGIGRASRTGDCPQRNEPG
jgi:alpha-L-arabinofuranosidase